MRKLSGVIVVILVVLGMAAPAFSAKLKMINKKCYTLSSASGPEDGSLVVLTSKSAGNSVKGANGSMKLYNVNALLWGFVSITGGARLTANGTQYNGYLTSYYYPYFFGVEFYINPDANGKPQVTGWHMTTDGGANFYSYTLNEINCKSVNF